MFDNLLIAIVRNGKNEYLSGQKRCQFNDLSMITYRQGVPSIMRRIDAGN